MDTTNENDLFSVITFNNESEYLLGTPSLEKATSGNRKKVKDKLK